MTIILILNLLSDDFTNTKLSTLTLSTCGSIKDLKA